MPNLTRHLLIAALLAILAGCTSRLPGITLLNDPNGGKSVIVTDSPGGNIQAFAANFRAWSKLSRVDVEIRQRCASACTQILYYFPSNEICLSPHAEMVFHAATAGRPFGAAGHGTTSGFGVRPEPDWTSTLLLFAMYPRWIEAYLSSNGAMGLDAGKSAAVIDAEKFWRHGYGVCSGNAASGRASAPDGKVPIG